MMSRGLFWLLLPLCAIQGLWLRGKATRLPGAAGERRGVSGHGHRLELLALGDSIIDGVGVSHIQDSLPVQFARHLARETDRRVHWRLEGKSGCDVVDALTRLRSIVRSLQPDLVLISIGVNDVTGMSSSRHWRQKLQELLDTLRAHWPDVRILFAGLPPMEQFPLPPQPLRRSLGIRAATLDHIAAELLAGYPNAVHVPTKINPQQHSFCADGFHPSAESCNLWARELAGIESRRDSK
jgi:lysophospholipase L1-like esterase